MKKIIERHAIAHEREIMALEDCTAPITPKTKAHTKPNMTTLSEHTIIIDISAI
jgi:hypothetical protein